MNPITEAEGLESLALLEERILETIEQLRLARREKAESEERARQLAEEVEALRRERRYITDRVEKLLAHIERLSQG
jgi:hypothetical protein